MQNTDEHSWAYYQERLDAISEHNSVPYYRAYDLFDKEEKHGQECLQYKGYLALSDAFKCIFLETVELFNTECRPKITTPPSDSYVVFVPRLVHSFKSLCGSERLALKGYPLPAYALLRNIFDNLVMVSAALQRITDFYSIDGVELGKKIDLKELKRKRKETEYNVRPKMTGGSKWT